MFLGKQKQKPFHRDVEKTSHEATMGTITPCDGWEPPERCFAHPTQRRDSRGMAFCTCVALSVDEYSCFALLVDFWFAVSSKVAYGTLQMFSLVT